MSKQIAKLIEIKTTNADGDELITSVPTGSQIDARSGLRYDITLDGRPLPTETEVVAEGDSLFFRLDGELLLEIEDWCGIDDSFIQVWPADVVPLESGSGVAAESLQIHSGACAIVAGTGEVGTLAGTTVAAGGGFPVWESLAGIALLAGLGGGSSGGSISAVASQPTLSLTADLEFKSSSAGKFYSNDSTPAIAGTTGAGAFVTVTLPTGEVLTTIADENGNWGVQPATPLSDGEVEFMVNAIDSSGTQAEPVTLSVTIDGTAPDAPNPKMLNGSITIDNAADGVADNSPTISGTGATPGDTISLTTATGEELTAQVDEDGNWSVSPSIALPEGSQQAVFTATDPAGNTSAPVTITLLIDTQAPDAPGIVLAPGSDTGNVGDVITHTSTPQLDGVGAPGDTISVTLPTGEMITTLVAPDGNWSVTPTVPLPDGDQLVTVHSTDPSGNISAPSVLTVTIDTVAPTAPAADLASVSDSGIAGDGMTNNVTPMIQGNGAEPGNTITVVTPTGEVLNGLVADDGTWSVTPTVDLAEGSHSVQIHATDVAGNDGPVTTVMINIDLTAPITVIPDLDISSDTGATGDLLTNVTLPVISGVGAEPGSMITVTTVVGETLTDIVGTDGSWSVSSSEAFPEGPNSVWATATDAAGNTSPVSATVITVDTISPNAPAAALDPASDSGLPGDNTTVDSTPTVSGAGANPGDTMTAVFSGGDIQSTDVADDGTWSITPTVALADGDHVVTLTATDPAGNTSNESSVTITVDTSISAPAPVLDAISDSGVAGDNITADTTPTITGASATPGDTINVTMATGEQLTTTVSPDGTWVVTPTLVLNDGTNVVSATAVDAAGNVSAAGTLSITVDSSIGAPVPNLDPDSDSGDAGDSTTNSSLPVISGSGGTPGDSIAVTTAVGEVLNTVVNSDGSWSVTPTTPFAEGVNEVGAVATDTAGNVSSAGVTSITVDTTVDAPAPALDSASDSGTLDDAITNDNTPVISGAGATAGDTISVTTAVGEILTMVVDANGAWSVTPTTPFEEGNNAISAVATDAAGNTSSAGTTVITVDTSAPSAPPAIVDPASDSATTGDGVTSDSTPTISGVGAGISDTITVTMPGGEILTTSVAPDGSWSVVPTMSLTDGDHAVLVTATDVAGNISDATTVAVTIDTTINPPAPVLNVVSDSGSVGDSTTSDSLPIISGAGATAGDIITVVTAAGDTLTANAAPDGTWSVMPTTPFSEGANTVTASATDAAGNVSEMASTIITIDTTAPNLPAGTLAASSDSGTPGDDLTSDSTPTITGGSAVPGDTVTVTTPTGEVLTTMVASDGTWSVTPLVPLADGMQDFTLVATDPSGNNSAAQTLGVTVDTTAPEITITTADSVIAWDSSTTIMFTLSEPVIDFTAVDVDVSGGVLSDFAGSGTSYSATFTPDIPGDGTISVTGGAFTDAAGLVNTDGADADNTATINVDGAPDDVGSGPEDTVITGNVLTNDFAGLSVDSFTIDGLPGSYAAGTTASMNGLGSVTMDAAGNYSFTPADDWSGTSPNISYSASGSGIPASTGTLVVTVTPVVEQAVALAPSSIYATAPNVVGQLSTDAQLDQGSIEALLGESSGWMDSFNPSSATNYNPNAVDGVDGDIRTFALEMSAGQEITFNWHFQSDEDESVGDISSGFEDIALMHVRGPDGESDSSILASSETYLESIGANTPNAALWQDGSFTMTAVEDGVHSFSFVVFNGGDDYKGARLNVDPWSAPIDPIDLPLFALDDPDGSEQFGTITISGVPLTASLTNGTSDDSGIWTLSDEDMDGLQLLLPIGFLGTVNLTATANTAETETGASSAPVTQVFTVEVAGAVISSLTATDSVETYAGTSGNDYMTASGGNDILSGGDGEDNLSGDTGNDTLDGEAGHDLLVGGTGNDVIDGGAGLDRIIGGQGSDTMTGGSEQDQFIWKAGDTGTTALPDADVITDFAMGSSGDLLILSDMLQGESYGNLDDFLHYTLSGADTIVHISSTGGYTNGTYDSTQTDLTIQLSGVDVVSGGSGLSSDITNQLLTSGNLSL